MIGDWEPKDCVAVLGAARKHTSQQLLSAFQVGHQLARLGKVVITGATTGIPYAAAIGAHKAGGLVIGVSPASSSEEHRSRYKKPLRQADVLIFSGQGPDGRSPIIMRSARASIFIGGELGTLGEFCSGWMTGGNVLGILRGAGGVTDRIEELLSDIDTSWGSQVVYDSDPVALVLSVCSAIDYADHRGLGEQDEPDGEVRKVLETVVNG